MIRTSLAHVRQIAIAQSPGQVAPAINVSILPNHADVSDKTWLSYEAPEASFSLGGMTWACLPEQSTVTVGFMTGVTVEVQYYPTWFVQLRRCSFKKHIVFLSCPLYMKEEYMKDVDEDTEEVLHCESDIRIATGWTLENVVKEIAKRAEIPIRVSAPTYHLPQPEIRMEIKETCLEFIQSLLPKEVEWVWMFGASEIVVSPRLPSLSSVGFVRGCHEISVTRNEVPPYQFFEFTGGNYRPVQLELTGNVHSKPFPEWVGQEVVQTLPAEETDIEIGDQHYTQSTQTTQRVIMNWFNQIFSIVERVSVTTGPHTNRDGAIIETQTAQRTETFVYENTDPLEYEYARQTKRVEVHRGFMTVVVMAQVVASVGQIYYLAEDGQIYGYTQYMAIPFGDRPAVRLTAYEEVGVIETITDEVTYIPIHEITQTWYEGAIKQQVTTLRGQQVQVNNFGYPASTAPMDLLQQILSDVGSADAITSAANYANALLEVNTLTHRSEDRQTYVACRRLQRYRVGRGVIENIPTTQRVVGNRMPGSPSQYLSVPLNVCLDTGGTGGEKVSRFIGSAGGNDRTIAKSASIATNNPTDFVAWASHIYYALTHPEIAVSLNSYTTLYPPGTRLPGVTMTSFRALESAKGGVSLEMGGA